MLMKKHFFKESNESIKFSIILLIVGLIFIFLIQRIGISLLDSGIIIILLVGYYCLDKFYFFPEGYDLKLFHCSMCFVACFLWNGLLKLIQNLTERRSKREITPSEEA
jgi:hypothetical protein